MRRLFSANDRISLKAFLWAYAVIAVWLGFTVIIDGVVRQQRLHEAALKNEPSAQPAPAFVFPAR
jgi:hypothetical protein